ncbi:DUF7224 domain-containing protein [Streptomyces sp. NRRL B-24484]|uniref:DUF7224 domain-containing protein n=1 Tax=Streptomyces sp. NRRL B-24484 TaxID=1463833 RepID=UPI0004C11A64|nr:ABC transporter permease [Streptomyces sp. NRRL B-24484]
MLRIYRTELRRSPLLLALPVMVLVDVAVLFGRSRSWMGVWPEASVAVQVVTLFLGPVLAAVSAWQAGRSSRTGMPESVLAAARPAWQAEAVRLAATLTLGFLAYGTGAVAAAAVSFDAAGPGFLWPSYLLLGAAILVSFAALGHLAGRWFPSPWFTPVVAALGTFIGITALGQNLGFIVLSGAPDRDVRPTPIALRLLLAAALVALAVFAPALPGRRAGLRARPLTWGLRGCATAAAAVVLVVFAAIPGAGGIQRDRTSADAAPLCRRDGDGVPEVCVWPEHRKYLPELTAMARRLSEVPQPWLGRPAAFYEEGLRRTGLGDTGFAITEGHTRTAAMAMAQAVFAQSLRHCDLPVDNAAAWRSSDRIHLWLEYRAMGVDPDVADRGLHMSGVADAESAARAAVVQPEQAQAQWTAGERAVLAAAGCTS